MTESPPPVAQSVSELMALLEGVAHVADGRLVIDDESSFRADGVRVRVWSATFSEDADVIEAARWIVWEASQSLGARVGQHQRPVPGARSGRGEWLHRAGRQPAHPGLRHGGGHVSGGRNRSTPARSSSSSRAASRSTRTSGRGEYITSVLAGCIHAGWRGPVFVQGDHYQFNAGKYAADPEATTEAIKKATRDAIGVGYGNIDIDSSTLVDLSQPTVDDQQRVNYERAAEISALIREVQPADMPVSIGGEIGEVGKQNSTEEELRTYLDGYRATLDRLAGPSTLGPLQGQRPDRHEPRWRAAARAAASPRSRSTSARSSGCRWWRASTAWPAPSSTVHRRCRTSSSIASPRSRRPRSTSPPASRTLLYEHPAFPADLQREIDEWCVANLADERKPGESDDVFIYKTRKKALGPFKRQLWELVDQGRDPGRPGEEAASSCSTSCAWRAVEQMVERYIKPPQRSRPAPDVLAEMGVAKA